MRALIITLTLLQAMPSFASSSQKSAGEFWLAAPGAKKGKKFFKGKDKHRGAAAAEAATPSSEAEAPSPEPAKENTPAAAVAAPVSTPPAAVPAAPPLTAPPAANLSEISAKAPPEEAPAQGKATGLSQALRVAVYDFEVDGVDAKIASVVTDSTLAEVRKLQSVSAIGMNEIREMLSHEANKQFVGCEENESCLAEIAGALGVDNLVSGKLSKVDDGTVFVVRRVDQIRAKVVGVVNRRLKGGSGEEFLAAIGPAIEELFPERGLRAGVQRGVAKEVALRLNPPPLPAWSFYTVAGGAVAAALAGGVFGLLTRDAQTDYTNYANSGVTREIDGADLRARGDRLEFRASTANYLFISAGALALTAGILYLFTDFQGYNAQAEVAK